MSLLNQVNRVVLASADSPEEAIHRFLTIVAEGASSVAVHRVRRKQSKVLQMKDMAISNQLESAERLILSYNDFLNETALNWASLAKQWSYPKNLDLNKILNQEITKFKVELVKSFEEMREAAISHIEKIDFSLGGYSNLTIKQKNSLNKVKNRLIKISEMNYQKFINDIVSGKISEAQESSSLQEDVRLHLVPFIINNIHEYFCIR